jgi:hypothetical protein
MGAPAWYEALYVPNALNIKAWETPGYGQPALSLGEYSVHFYFIAADGAESMEISKLLIVTL